MKKVFFALLLAFITPALSHAQGSQQNETTDTTHVMLHPDANTKYLDENGDTIDNVRFMTAVASGHYRFEPQVDHGKIITLRLAKTTGSLQLGADAPNFSFTDINGHSWSLNALKGKIVVMNFWFTACMPCRQEIPELNALVSKFKGNPDVVFLAVTYDPTDRVRSFLTKTTFNYTLAAGQQALIDQYGISGYPTNLVIDKQGTVAFLLTSYSSDNVAQLEGVIEALTK